MKSTCLGVRLFLILLCAGSWSHAQVGASFGAGRSRFSLNAGYSSVNGHDYTVVGVGAGYYLFEGFEVGLDGEAWMGDRPHLYSVSPGARYVLDLHPSFKPYVGGFYKRTFYDILENRDSIGGRAGLVSALSEHAYVSAGIVYEKMFNCDKSFYSRCEQVYPEVGISLSY